MAQQTAQPKAIVKYGPYGNQGQPTFHEILEKTDVVRTITVQTGAVVDSITFEILNRNGAMRTVKFGGNGGPNVQKIHLRNGEHITQISGNEANNRHYPTRLIVQIRIHTNLVPQGYGPYGRMDDCYNIRPFKAHDPIVGSVVGFFGISRIYLDSIGVIVDKDNGCGC